MLLKIEQFFSERVDNFVGKGENAGSFPTIFQRASFSGLQNLGFFGKG